MDAHWEATAVNRAATVERTDAAVDLKYSLNLVAEPELAAVEAALERVTHLLKASVVAER